MNLSELTIGEFLERVGAKAPVPGGGAVAGVVGALSAVLAAMAVRYSQGNKNLAAHGDAHEAALEQLERARAMLLELAREDAEAYEALNAAMKRPKDDPGRAAEVSARALDALHPPMATIAVCAEMLRLFESLAPITSKGIRSDLAIAAVLAEATARASKWNVAVNAPLIGDAPGREQIERADAMLRKCGERLRVVVEPGA